MRSKLILKVYLNRLKIVYIPSIFIRYSSGYELTYLRTGIYDKFAEAFASAVSELRVANGLEQGITKVCTWVPAHYVH